MKKTSFGRSVFVALDHGLHWGAYNGFENPEKLLKQVLEAGPDGILASVPFLRRYRELISSYNIYTIGTLDLLHDSTLPGVQDNTEIHTQVFSPEYAADIADAAKVALVYGREDPSVLEENIEFVANASETYQGTNTPLIVEPTLWGSQADDEFDLERLTHANRIAFELGADILKSPYPPEGFDRIAENAPQPVYIAGGPTVDTDREVLEMVRRACDQGAEGVMFGRNIWQREDPTAIIQALTAIVHNDASVDEANKLL